MNQKLTETYKRNRDVYAVGFPAAHRFLTLLENASSHGLWLSTSINAHLYKHDAFLTYIRFGNLKHREPMLVLSPNFHLRIAESASDQARVLFPTVVQTMLNRHSSGSPIWWRELSRGAFELRNTSPDIFFDELVELLRTLAVT